MSKVLYLFNYAFVNILFVNICLNDHTSVVGQILRLSVNETTKFDALNLRGLYRHGIKLFFNVNQGNSTKLFKENQRQSVR